MDFWMGLIVGLFIGATLGVLVVGLLFGSKQRSRIEDVFENDIGSNEFLRWVIEERSRPQ
jgi:hypothetical protein